MAYNWTPIWLLLGLAGALCAMTLLDLVGGILMVSLTWPWMIKAFPPLPDAKLGSANWATCDFSWDSIHGVNCGTCGNSPTFEVCTSDSGLIIRAPLYSPPFIRLWQWPFAARLFPPCLIPWDKVRSISPRGCIVETTDKEWPTMCIRTSDELLTEITSYRNAQLSKSGTA